MMKTYVDRSFNHSAKLFIQDRAEKGRRAKAIAFFQKFL
jgi:hypothetical protein